MTFACEKSIDGTGGQDDGWDAGSVETDGREETMGSRYMEETKTLRNVLDATCINEANLTGFVRGEILVAVKMGFLMGRGHLGAIVKVSSNAIKVVMTDFLDGEIGGWRFRSEEVREGQDWHGNGRDCDIIQEGIESRISRSVGRSGFAGGTRKIENVSVANI